MHLASGDVSTDEVICEKEKQEMECLFGPIHASRGIGQGAQTVAEVHAEGVTSGWPLAFTCEKEKKKTRFPSGRKKEVCV